MGSNAKANQADLGTFTHILAYSGMFWNYLGIFRTLFNSSIFRTLIYSKSETEEYSEPFQISTMERFAKIVNSYSCFCKLKLFSQYQLFTFSPFLIKVYFLFQKCFIWKSIAVQGTGVLWILIYPRYVKIFFL